MFEDFLYSPHLSAFSSAVQNTRFEWCWYWNDSEGCCTSDSTSKQA